MADWITLDKDSGTGNGVVHAIIAIRHTGRLERQAQLTFRTQDGVSEQVRTIVQSGRPEFVSIPSTLILPKEGGKLTLVGTSNSPRLQIMVNLEDLLIPTPVFYTANGNEAENDEPIEGDPGATEEFTFVVEWDDVQPNETTEPLTSSIEVRTDNNQRATCEVIQPNMYQNLTANGVNLRTASNEQIRVLA